MAFFFLFLLSSVCLSLSHSVSLSASLSLSLSLSFCPSLCSIRTAESIFQTRARKEMSWYKWRKNVVMVSNLDIAMQQIRKNVTYFYPVLTTMGVWDFPSEKKSTFDILLTNLRFLWSALSSGFCQSWLPNGLWCRATRRCWTAIRLKMARVVLPPNTFTTHSSGNQFYYFGTWVGLSFK